MNQVIWNSFIGIEVDPNKIINVKTRFGYLLDVYCIKDQIDNNYYFVEKNTNCIIRQIDINYDQWTYYPVEVIIKV